MLLPQLHRVIFERYSGQPLLIVEIASEGRARYEDGLLVAVEPIVLDDQVEVVNQRALLDDPEQTGGVDRVITLLDVQGEVLQRWAAHTSPLLYKYIIFL